MKRADFHYELPPELIAQLPPATRSGGRMLCVNPRIELLRDGLIADFPQELAASDLLVLNDTRVIRARLHGVKDSGGKIEALVERVLDVRRALVQIRASKPPRVGMRLLFSHGALAATMRARHEDLYELEFDCDDLFAALDAHGELPLPPYIERPAGADDDARYQTVWAATPGAVAAPTAGLHFDEAMLDAISARGIEIGRATLHVGAGTFQPVRVDDLAAHRMHAEVAIVNDTLAAQVAATRARGGRVVAVGTTVVRALESAAAAHGGSLESWRGETRLFITPGYRFAVVDALLTNFHLPESTLLMLVSAFGGIERIRAAYRHAIASRYRFFSYGDAMWLPARADTSI
jgi:S-adenosylmethionine:tRNA ribosyltransferase-isomerase